ncbi:uncharacterized protein LOC121421609 isoform X1 [Lytechinus variegatus]|uniref:uncharacterized protein LOC121421609 isoform X1 n=1 Tax=Lytechinus variegatus TaxID=7654 RepID=UPI001BB1D8D7|nr:uncharacterized protein LOC121421609 isoform X1 [Lytechinus variegatus]
MSRSIIAASRVFSTVRIFNRSAFSVHHLSHTGQSKKLFKMETRSSGERQMSSEEPRRFAKPDEVNYALRQDMGQGYTRSTIEISALGTKYNMVYGEWVPVDRSVEGCPVVICIHGTPATEGAFRPIGSRIASGGYRVLAVNFPGMGYTQIDPERKYDYSSSDKAELVKGFITAMQLDSVAMVIGHSSGSHVVAELGADRALEGILQSTCFLCGTGITPHKMQKLSTRIPYAASIIFRALYMPVIGWIVEFLCSKFIHYMGFRGRTTEAQVLSIYEAALLDFTAFARSVKRIAEKKLPVLLFFSLDDVVVEAELLQENIDILGIPEADIKDYDVNGESELIYGDETLRRVVRFAKATHRLQFTNPEKTTAEIVSLLDALGKR